MVRLRRREGPAERSHPTGYDIAHGVDEDHLGEPRRERARREVRPEVVEADPVEAVRPADRGDGDTRRERGQIGHERARLGVRRALQADPGEHEQDPEEERREQREEEADPRSTLPRL